MFQSKIKESGEKTVIEIESRHKKDENEKGRMVAKDSDVNLCKSCEKIKC